MLQLSAECRRRGLRTVVNVSDPERLIGQAQYDALRHIIREECDGFILHVTREIEDSACVWNVEVPAALEAFDNAATISSRSFVTYRRETRRCWSHMAGDSHLWSGWWWRTELKVFVLDTSS